MDSNPVVFAKSFSTYSLDWSSYNDRLQQESQLLVKHMTQNACQELLKDCKNQDYIANVAFSFDGFRLVKGALQLVVSFNY